MTSETMDARRIATHIVAIEQALDLDHPDWAIADVHLWPLYRLELYHLFIVGLSGSTRTGGASTAGAAFRRSHPQAPAAARPCNVWLVSDGISFARLGDGQVERFCAPIHQALSDMGIGSVIIDRGSAEPRRSDAPMRWWAPMTQRAKVFGTLQAKLTPDRRHDRLVALVEDRAARLGITLPRLDPRRFNAKTKAVLALARRLERRMRAERVKAVFVVGYYDVGGYAYVLAARRAGAMSIDVQHGVTGDLNVAYADWTVEPAAGLPLLPSHFWSWTEEDARIVRAWSARHRSPQRTTIVGGHPFMEAWRAGSLRLPADAEVVLDRLCADAGDRPRVLVTLQPHLVSDEALAPLIDAWTRQPGAAWWIRLHPMAMADRDRIESLLKANGVEHWNIVDATALPLPVLLTRASLHATHSSSVVIEAQLLGIRSVIWSTYGEQLFEAHIGRGDARRVDDGESFASQLRLTPDASEGGSATPQASQLTRALQDLLQAAS